MKALDDFYLKQDEPFKATLLALKEIISSHDKKITNELKYGMPVFCYKGKMFCYYGCTRNINNHTLELWKANILASLSYYRKNVQG